MRTDLVRPPLVISVANVALGYRLTRRALLLTLDLFNLLNTTSSDIDYYYVSGSWGVSRRLQDVHFHPTLPRTLRLKLTVGL